MAIVPQSAHYTITTIIIYYFQVVMYSAVVYIYGVLQIGLWDLNLISIVLPSVLSLVLLILIVFYLPAMIRLLYCIIILIRRYWVVKINNINHISNYCTTNKCRKLLPLHQAHSLMYSNYKWVILRGSSLRVNKV